MRILVVEDDRRLADLLRRGLVGEGYAVDVGHDGRRGLELALENPYDAVVLDVMLPYVNGYRLCARLREAGQWVPVLMLTAKDGEYDQAEGLDTGADDYVTKPFSFIALAARLRALIRRGRPERPTVLHVGDLEVDPASRRCRRGTVPVVLTAREFAVLEYLAQRADETISKTEILQHVWDEHFDGDVNIVEVYVSALRRKIDAPFGRHTIRTVRGAGLPPRPGIPGPTVTWVGARQLLRRMRPGTIRMRLALLAAVITLVPLTAAAIPIARTERTAQMQNADRKAAEMSWAIDTMISGLHGRNPPDCTRSFQPAHESPDKDVSLCRPTQKTRESSGNLSLIPWTDPVRGPIPIRQIIYRKYVHAGVDDIAVTQSLEAEQTRLNTIVWFLIGAMVGMTLVVSGTTWFAMRPGTAPGRGHPRRFRRPERTPSRSTCPSSSHRQRDRPPGHHHELHARPPARSRRTAASVHRRRLPRTTHPLACLRTELELALHHPHTADWPRVVRAAHDDTLRLQTLTTDLLLLARLDAGPTDQPPGPTIDLTDLVRDETSRRTPPPHLTLTVHVGPEPITVNGQQALLARVLGNLLDNAERHAAGTITVRLAYDTEHRQAVLEVLDDGLGIPSEDHQRIFERFSRLDDARTRDGGGAGLGLAIAARIATTHHGTLTIVPSSQGAHFLLRLPTSTPPQDPLTTAAFSSPTEAT